MPANILRLRPDLALNVAAIQLGTHKNAGATPFQDTLTIINEGSPIPYLSLPLVFPPCDWATIGITVRGCVFSSLGTAPAGSTIPTWTPAPPGAPIPLVLPSYTPVPGLNVTVITAGMMIGLPYPTVQPGGTPGNIDCMSLPGNRYELDFLVMPLPGVTGIKTWEFRLVSPLAERVTVSANLIDFLTVTSE
jgi:hypothetical protein